MRGPWHGEGMFKTILKYVVTVVVPLVVQVVGQKYLGTAGAAAAAGTVGVVGARILHTTPAP